MYVVTVFIPADSASVVEMKASISMDRVIKQAVLKKMIA
jgi:hypothetical protein